MSDAQQGSGQGQGQSFPDPATVAQAHGKPYPPQEQALGETPSVIPDVPVCAVFLFLFLCAAAGHMGLFKFNMRRGKKFVISGMMFGFCFTRICATTLRIAWSFYPSSVRVGIAAMVFVYAGIILLFIANLFFTQRVVRAQHPHIGWSKPFSIALPVLLVIIIGSIICLIVGVILSFYTLSESTLDAVRDIQLYGETLYAIVAFLPIPIVLASVAGRHFNPNRRSIDKFGTGSMRAKILLILVSAVFLDLGACWRAATLYLPPRASTNPETPWYFSKACFYVFNFSIEICVTLAWLALRIDKRFFVPNGAKGPYSYAGGFTFAGEPGNEKIALGNRDSMRHLTGSQASGLNSARVSWGGSRSSLGRASRVSWGGISREDVSAGIGEDGFQPVPYGAFEERIAGEGGFVADEDGDLGSGARSNYAAPTAADVGVQGAEAEMGWDPRSGKWALRPVSSTVNLPARPVSTKSGI
ncbi:hypothetical protein KC332_g9541 [Hortaea werneckii]|uniref:Uncharacterized protein n=2 Tax=Hortaea werneckii TaxID=91943 RepID=A0A3M7IIV6_HORWE|nr:hypothetical protein KC350_g10705 [Hortaea werneckii]OTA23146.1 hypothetical protein BTJ68_14381 [Hortaea werneckii EXF-2000]KAI6820393.1 hypothetical protein KC358_g9454 [Hortaea werneckii]KAI6923052.1 hypothetical protein KC348_g9615 [Hortaea werneckii]KAI6932046.1 hypothetical protein KC341_g9230 [Hortaea werneckii]